MLLMKWFPSLQICQLQERYRWLWDVKHGPYDSGRVYSVPSSGRIRLHGEQLCRGTHQAVRVQEAERSHPEDSGFSVPRRRLRGRMQGTVLEFTLPLPFIWFRWYRWYGLPPQSSFQSHLVWHPGKKSQTRTVNSCQYLENMNYV